MPEVTYLELNDNNFSGQPPINISGDKLEKLVLSSNSIAGRIPTALSNSQNLQSLLLDRNRFDNKIPEEIFRLKFLSIINVSRNNLSGQIPPSISSFSSLYFVDFSENGLEGNIPDEIATLKYLSILNLSHNQLTGQLLNNISFMPSLASFDICNNLSGKVQATGSFLLFNDSSYSGNSNLCSPSNNCCQFPAHSLPARNLGNRELYSYWKVIYSIMIMCVLCSYSSR